MSDASDAVLKKCKEHGYKPSQVIDAVVFFIGVEGCMNLNKMKKRLEEIREGKYDAFVRRAGP